MFLDFENVDFSRKYGHFSVNLAIFGHVWTFISSIYMGLVSKFAEISNYGVAQCSYNRVIRKVQDGRLVAILNVSKRGPELESGG